MAIYISLSKSKGVRLDAKERLTKVIGYLITEGETKHNTKQNKTQNQKKKKEWGSHILLETLIFQITKWR